MEKNNVGHVSEWRYGKDLINKLGDLKNWKCETCGSEKNLHIHHKDRKGINVRKSERNNNIENLQLLCCSCHGKIHFKDRKRTSGWKWKKESIEKMRKSKTKFKDYIQVWNFRTMQYDVSEIG